jgi:hypothetical protein
MTQPATDPSEAPATDTREAAMAAAREALKAYATDDDGGAPETPADPDKPPSEDPAPPKPKPPKTDDDEADGEEKPAEAPAEKPPNRIAVELRARQQAQRIREAAQADAAREMSAARQAREEAERLRAQYEPYARAAQKLGQSPMEAAREFARLAGRSEAEIVDGFVAGGVPDPVRDLRAENETLKQRLDQQQHEWRQFLQQQEHERAQSNVRHYRDDFLRAAANAEQHPLLASIYEDDVAGLIARGDEVGRAYFQRTGLRPDPVELAEALEVLESDRAKKYNDIAQRRQAGAPDSRGARANGHSPISTATTSQRATAPRSTENLSDDERREEAIRAAKQALKAYRGGGAR